MPNIFEDFSFDLRRSVRPAVKIAIITPLVLMFASSLVVAAYVFFDGRDQPSPETLDSGFPLTARTSSTIRAFDCARKGTRCATYGESTQFLMATTSPSGFTYTPDNNSDPGKSTPSGQKIVRLNIKTPRADWEAVGAAVTLDGQANPVTVYEESVTELSPTLASYTVPATTRAPAMLGTMEFRQTADRVVVVGVDYVTGSDAAAPSDASSTGGR